MIHSAAAAAHKHTTVIQYRITVYSDFLAGLASSCCNMLCTFSHDKYLIMQHDHDQHYALVSRHCLQRLILLRSQFGLEHHISFYTYRDARGQQRPAVIITGSALQRFLARRPRFALRPMAPWAGCTQELCSLPF